MPSQGSVAGMFERFTDRARRAVVEAQEEARLLRHTQVGTEHLLLGLIKDRQGVAGQALLALDVNLDAVRERVREIDGEGAAEPQAGGHIPFTPRAKKTLELALRESRLLRHAYIGTEHILLGLVAEGEGVAARVLAELGVDAQRIREQVMRTLQGAGRGPAATPIPMSLGPVPGRGARTQIAGLNARLDAVEYRLSALAARLDRLADLLRRHGIDPADPGAGDPPAD